MLGGSWALHPLLLWVQRWGVPFFCPERCVSPSWGCLAWHWAIRGTWGWVSLGFGAPSTPLSPRVSAGCSEAVYLLAPSADGHWLAAVSGDWAIHIYNLKCFKVGLGVTPQPQGAWDGGLSSPWESSLHPQSRAEVGVWERGSEAVLEVLLRGGCVGEVLVVALVGAISAVSPPAASLRGAHLRLRRIGPRHPPQHQQPGRCLLGPAGRSSPAPAPVALPPSLCLSPCPRAFRLGWSCWRGGAGRSRRP